MIPGVNAPPIHPWCRSTTVPDVGNWRDKFFKEREGKYRVEGSFIESGALNNKSDEYGIKRNRHAQIYYNSVRNQENRQRFLKLLKILI